MSVFTWVEDYNGSEEHQPRVRAVKFGDGYQQRSTDGINTDAGTWNLTFSGRSTGEASAITTFLGARGGVENFDWTPYGELAAIKVVCPKWARQPQSYGVWTVTATFSQVFEA